MNAEEKLNTVLAGITEEESISGNEDDLDPLHAFLEFVLASPERVESDQKNIPLVILLDDEIVTELLVDSVAFGILWEQEITVENGDGKGTRNIVAPFGYFTVDEVLNRQTDPEYEAALWYVYNNIDDFLSGDMEPSDITEIADIGEDTAFGITQAIRIGVLMESAGLEDASRPAHRQQDILQQYGGDSSNFDPFGIGGGSGPGPFGGTGGPGPGAGPGDFL